MKMNYLAIDYGSRRIGLAKGDDETKTAHPLTTLDTGTDYWAQLGKIIRDEQVGELVVGLPRTLGGQDSPQTKEARFFALELAAFKLPIHLQDEADTSEQARLRIGKKLTHKGQIDAEAAAIILEDFLETL
jgi:putative holliday junction resolvase